MIRFRRPMRVRFRLLCDDVAELSVPIALIVCCVVAFLVTGCSFSPSADVIKALATDPNSLCFNVTTPWGGENFDRNHGCPGNSGSTGSGTTVIAPSSMGLTVIKP